MWLQLVHVCEQSTLQMSEALEVASLADAERALQCYRLSWRIEGWHGILKLTQRDSVVEAGIRWRGGRSCELSVPRSLPGGKLRQTPRSVVAEIDALLDSHRDSDVARILNERGRVSGMGGPLHRRIVQQIRKVYGLKSRYERLRERGLLTVNEMAGHLGVTPGTVRR